MARARETAIQNAAGLLHKRRTNFGALRRFGHDGATFGTSFGRGAQIVAALGAVPRLFGPRPEPQH
jgi:hypothetical protein